MYQSFRDQISKEITTSFDAALSGPYSLFIDDRPTGTGKTFLSCQALNPSFMRV